MLWTVQLRFCSFQFEIDGGKGSWGYWDWWSSWNSLQRVLMEWEQQPRGLISIKDKMKHQVPKAAELKPISKTEIRSPRNDRKLTQSIESLETSIPMEWSSKSNQPGSCLNTAWNKKSLTLQTTNRPKWLERRSIRRLRRIKS